MRKRGFLSVIIALMLFAGCSPSQSDKPVYSGDFAEKGSDTDISMIAETYSKTDSVKNNKIELQYASIYSAITADDSEKAVRVIGKIEGVPVTAKELELEALRVQVNKMEHVYRDAWNRLEVYIRAEQLTKEFGISVEEEARKQVEQTRQWLDDDNDSNAQKYFGDLFEAFRMTEDEFWNMQYGLMKRQLIISRAKKYLEEHDMLALDNTFILSEITDEEYIEKIKRD
jgi:hypothetical protein